MYTDGVNEATDRSSCFFGLERLKSILKSSNGTDAIRLIQNKLKSFADGCEQHDDITMLTFTSKAEKLVIPARKECFADIKDWILNDETISDNIRKTLCLIAEEIFINISSYAYSNNEVM